MAQYLSEVSMSSEDVPADEDWKAAFISGEFLPSEEVDSKAFSFFEGASDNAEEWKTWIESFPESSLGSKLDSGMWGTLHDNLVEKIIARMSFRSFFQASSLSKTWRDRLRSDQLFRSEVQHNARASWDSYSPLFVDGKKDLWGFERGSKRWHQLPSPRFYIPEYVVFDWELKAGAGSLLCWTSEPEFHIHVTNPLTQSWKRLPPRPDMEYPNYVHMDWEAGSPAYRVIVPISEFSLSRQVQIFDSSSDSWTTESYYTGANFGAVLGGSAYINGVLHMFSYTLARRPVHKLISFDVKEKIWKELPLVYQFIERDRKSNQLHKRLYKIHLSRVLVCQSNVILAIFHTSIVDKAPNKGLNCHNNRSQHELEESDVIISMFRLDLESGLAFEVYVPLEMTLRVLHYPWESAKLIFIGDCIYIRPLKTLSPIIHYNVATEEWHWVNYAADSPASICGAPVPRCKAVIYQPGFNTFLEV